LLLERRVLSLVMMVVIVVVWLHILLMMKELWLLLLLLQLCAWLLQLMLCTGRKRGGQEAAQTRERVEIEPLLRGCLSLRGNMFRCMNKIVAKKSTIDRHQSLMLQQILERTWDTIGSGGSRHGAHGRDQAWHVDDRLCEDAVVIVILHAQFFFL